MNSLQQKAYGAVSAALPLAIDPAKITVEPGLSYLPSPIKFHDYAVGVMAVFGSVVESCITVLSYWTVQLYSVPWQRRPPAHRHLHSSLAL